MCTQESRIFKEYIQALRTYDLRLWIQDINFSILSMYPCSWSTQPTLQHSRVAVCLKSSSPGSTIFIFDRVPIFVSVCGDLPLEVILLETLATLYCSYYWRHSLHSLCMLLKKAIKSARLIVFPFSSKSAGVCTISKLQNSGRGRHFPQCKNYITDRNHIGITTSRHLVIYIVY